MTLPTSTRVTDPYETDGVQRDFEFDFPAFYNADTGHYGIEVRRLTALDYEVIDKSLYDIFLNDEDKSGYIRFHVAPMAGDDIYIAGDTTRSQQLNLINYGRYSAQSIEKAFDLIVALIQEFVSKVDEETRQRILADQALRDFLLIKFNQFTAEVTTKIDKHIGDINGFMSSLIPMFVCIMRKEIANYAETGMQDVIDEKLSGLSTQVANALAENDAALIRLNESILKIEAATTATAIGARLFDTPAAGVNPVTGVPAGSYFNVRSPNTESYVDEYRNVGGVPMPTGKSFPSAVALSDAVNDVAEVKDAIDAVAALALIKEANTWQQNRDIIQSINDDLYLNFGGGKIQLPSGSFYLKGVLLDSGVQVYGNKTVILHPDNYDGDIFETRMYATTGSCTKNSKTVTVTNSSNFRVGSLIAIRGGGGIGRTQNTALVSSISPTDTSNLQLSSTTGFLSGGLLQVGEELISYTSMDVNGVLGGVVRGVLGTVASSHAAGAQIGVAMQHISEIIAISGNTITILDAVKTTASGTTVQAGGQGCKVIDVSYSGERQLDVSGWRWSPCRFRLHRFGEIDIYAENCENGFSLTCSSDNVVNFKGKDLAKIGGAGGAVSAGGWLFQHCHRNTVNAKIIGNTNVGVYLDDKSNYGTEWDGECNGNSGDLTFKFDNYNSSSNLTVGLGIASGSYNKFNVVSDRVRTAVTLTASSQVRNTDGYTPDCKGNFIDISMPYGNSALICDGGAVGNTFLINQGTYNIEPTVIDGNIILSSNSKTEIGNYLRFRNGSSAKPGISFSEDPSHGFVRSVNNDIRLFRAGIERLRFVDNGLYFPSGQIISSAGDGLRIGGSPSQKFGFFGKTPIAQPTVSSAATDAATTQALVNELRSTLILLGLIAPS